ncbi:MAG: DegQ family serine endoprotease [Chitinivibrionales bacterium]|nr:DegQ family serine endoprotease [Chitinivibrionales bacterium]
MNKNRQTRFARSALLLLLLCMMSINCKFTYAENKRPVKDSVVFGAQQKPLVQASPQYESFKNIFSDIAAKSLPTVVSITSTKIDTVIYRDPFSQFFGSPFEDFFGTPRNRGQQRQPEQKQEQRSSGVGSGVIVSKDGYILTNYHVVGDASEITVQTYDDRDFEAEIVGSDSLSDVAVIKIKEKVNDLAVAYLGNSEKLRPGDWVMAVGNPFNLTSTVTVGIVSAIGRNTGGTTMYQNFIQTDAAINPGNSGGALINIDGELIGINTMIVSSTGGYMGIGFAVPINMAKRIMEQLIYTGKVNRGWLGIGINDIDNNMKEALGLQSKNGVLVTEVFENMPAAQAGLKVGDVIVSIDGIPTKDANTLRNTVASIAPQKKVPIEIIRNGEKKNLSVILTDREKAIVKTATSTNEQGQKEGDKEKSVEVDLNKKLGFSVGAITQDVKNALNLKSSVKGVLVTSIEANSLAARKGLQENDIIKKVKIQNSDFIEISDVNQFKKAISPLKKGDSVLFYVERNNASFFIASKAN